MNKTVNFLSDAPVAQDQITSLVADAYAKCFERDFYEDVEFMKQPNNCKMTFWGATHSEKENERRMKTDKRFSELFEITCDVLKAIDMIAFLHAEFSA